MKSIVSVLLLAVALLACTKGPTPIPMRGSAEDHSTCPGYPVGCYCNADGFHIGRDGMPQVVDGWHGHFSEVFFLF